MNSTAPLTGSHLRTHTTIFQRPVSRELRWNDVHALLCHLGEVESESNGNLKVTRNGQGLIFHPPGTEGVAETEEFVALRHFLARTGSAAQETSSTVARWLVVIDHGEARVYRSAETGSVPQQIRPHVTDDFFRHAPNSKEQSHERGSPGAHTFFEPLAAVLNCAGMILIFDGSAGAERKTEQFAEWLKQHRPKVAERIVGAWSIEMDDFTDEHLLARARMFYGQRPMPRQ